MPIVRLIYVTVKPDQTKEAEHIWKTECAPLMIKQPGCLSEQLLKCLDSSGEYISYAEWDNQENIDRYLASAAHQEIVSHTRKLRSEKPIVKRYQSV